MQLSFTHYQERKDADGQSYLDVECMLFTSEPKMTRIRISIPSLADIDPMTAMHTHQPPVVHFYEQTEKGL